MSVMLGGCAWCRQASHATHIARRFIDWQWVRVRECVNRALCLQARERDAEPAG